MCLVKVCFNVNALYANILRNLTQSRHYCKLAECRRDWKSIREDGEPDRVRCCKPIYRFDLTQLIVESRGGTTMYTGPWKLSYQAPTKGARLHWSVDWVAEVGLITRTAARAAYAPDVYPLEWNESTLHTQAPSPVSGFKSTASR